MNLPLLNWLFGADGLPALVHDLRSGRAGLVLRLALSLALAGLAIGLMFGIFGVIQAANRRIDDEHVVIGLALAGIL